MTLVDLPISHPPRSRALPILAMYVLAGAIVSICLWSFVDSGVRSPIYVLQLTLCAAAGPLYLITSSTTGMTEARYTVVGPLVGATCSVLWLVTVLLVPGLRRVPVLLHLLAAVFWLFCGVMLLLVTGTK
jgi:hypothetical protein